jgi:hypothetical protein
VIAEAPWILSPAAAIVLAVLATHLVSASREGDETAELRF